MRKKSVFEKILHERDVTKRKQIRNALRGAAKPWTLEKASFTFSRIQCPKEKIRMFNLNVGSLFPLILDLIVHGRSFPQIEKSLSLTPRMLWRWLNIRPQLMEEVRKAKRLREGTRVLADWDVDPLDPT